MAGTLLLSLEDICRAAERLRGIANCTSVMTERTRDAMIGRPTFAGLTENSGTGDATLATDELAEEFLAKAVKTATELLTDFMNTNAIR